MAPVFEGGKWAGGQLGEQLSSRTLPWNVEGARFVISTRAVFEDAAARLGWAFDRLDHVEDAHFVEVDRERVPTGGSGVGSHPSLSGQRCHRLGEEPRRRPDRISELTCFGPATQARQLEQCTGGQVRPSCDGQSHSCQL